MTRIASCSRWRPLRGRELLENRPGVHCRPSLCAFSDDLPVLGVRHAAMSRDETRLIKQWESTGEIARSGGANADSAGPCTSSLHKPDMTHPIAGALRYVAPFSLTSAHRFPVPATVHAGSVLDHAPRFGDVPRRYRIHVLHIPVGPFHRRRRFGKSEVNDLVNR